jgi:hypothetical protein
VGTRNGGLAWKRGSSKDLFPLVDVPVESS